MDSPPRTSPPSSAPHSASSATTADHEPETGMKARLQAWASRVRFRVHCNIEHISLRKRDYIVEKGFFENTMRILYQQFKEGLEEGRIIEFDTPGQYKRPWIEKLGYMQGSNIKGPLVFAIQVCRNEYPGMTLGNGPVQLDYFLWMSGNKKCVRASANEPYSDCGSDDFKTVYTVTYVSCYNSEWTVEWTGLPEIWHPGGAPLYRFDPGTWRPPIKGAISPQTEGWQTLKSMTMEEYCARRDGAGVFSGNVVGP